MLLSVEETIQKVKSGKPLSLAGDEKLLKELPNGNWIGGTIPYFMDVSGGTISQDKIFVNELPDYVEKTMVKSYDNAALPNIPKDAPENGFSIIIIPATSEVHLNYAQNAPDYDELFMKPIIGWISGIHLNDLGKISPKVFNGQTGEMSDEKAVVMHIELPAEKMAAISIVNLFEQGQGDVISFPKTGFNAKDCFVNGEKHNFADYLLQNKIDTKLPLVADYAGAMINVSFQEIQEDEKNVSFYAPVFPDIEYKIASPVVDYVTSFKNSIPNGQTAAVFSCNCILNFLYSELENKKTANMTGPVTFGEVAYQLLNQTFVYLEIFDA